MYIPTSRNDAQCSPYTDKVRVVTPFRSSFKYPTRFIIFDRGIFLNFFCHTIEPLGGYRKSRSRGPGCEAAVLQCSLHHLKVSILCDKQTFLHDLTMSIKVFTHFYCNLYIFFTHAPHIAPEKARQNGNSAVYKIRNFYYSNDYRKSQERKKQQSYFFIASEIEHGGSV